MPEIAGNLQKRLSALKVRPEDVKEKFVRSKGPGGQNVNKVSTCVYLKHLPTGLEVKCRILRSQVLNRNLAWEMLLGKIEEKARSERALRRENAARILRQRRKRSKRAKLRILEAKRRHSDKKFSRRKIREIEIA